MFNIGLHVPVYVYVEFRAGWSHREYKGEGRNINSFINDSRNNTSYDPAFGNTAAYSYILV